MKGMATGTIMPWSGGEDTVPKGWISCTGETKSTVDYPDLYAIIGQYYGGSGNFFKLPDLNAKAIADMKTSYLPSGTSTVFSAQIGTNQSNVSNVVYQSNLALTVAVDNNLATGNYSGKISGQTLNPTAYFDEVAVAGRCLGDFHWPTHGHAGSFSSILTSGNNAVEKCQTGFASNPSGSGCDSPGGLIDFFQTGDCCDNDNLLYSECNTPGSTINNYYKTSIIGGIPGGGGFNYVNYPITNAPGRINTAPKNWLGNSDSTLLKTGSYNFPTTISGPTTVWPNSSQTVDQGMDAHFHSAVQWSFNLGSFQVQPNIVVTDVGAGNVTPVNQGMEELLQFDVNTSTPSLRVMYIIKAW
jgi:microcystin-dependent protein